MHRKEIKRLAKSKVTARLGAVMGTWFAWLGIELAAILIAAVISLFAFAGPTMLWAARSFSVLGIMIIGPALIMMEWVLAVLLIQIPLAPLLAGFMRFCSNLQRGKPASAAVLFECFRTGRRFGSAVKMGLCIWLRSFLWGLIPSTVSLLANLLTDSLEPLAVLLQLVLMVLIMAKVSSYVGGYVLIQDDETMGAWRAVSASAELFRGRYGQLLTFCLSFLPWVLLAVPVLLAGLLIGLILNLIGLPVFLIPLLAWGVTLVLFGFVYTYQMVSMFEWLDFLRGGVSLENGQTFPVPGPAVNSPGGTPYGATGAAGVQQDFPSPAPLEHGIEVPPSQAAQTQQPPEDI